MTSPNPPARVPLSRIPLNVSFLVAMILFTLPFVNIRCLYQTQTVTGVQLVTGFENSNEFMSIGNRTLEPGSSPTVAKRTQPNVFAILALVAGIAGFGISFSSSRRAGQWCLAAALAGITAMIILFFDIKSSVNRFDMGGLGKDKDLDLRLTAEFTSWFYLCAGAFIIAAIYARRYMLAVNKALLLQQLDNLPQAPGETGQSGENVNRDQTA